MGPSLRQPSDVTELMPCPLESIKIEDEHSDSNWIFWSERPNDELNYQSKKIAAPAPVVPTYTGIDKETIESIFQTKSFSRCLVQFWAPVKVKGSTFLSTADQPFFLTKRLSKRLCSYRRRCVDTLIPVDIDDANGEALLGPPARVFIRGFPEHCEDISCFSAVEFPLLQDAIKWGIQSYCAVPVFKLLEKHCLGVFEIASTYKVLYYPDFFEGLDLGSSGLYSPCWPKEIRSRLSELWTLALDRIQARLDEVRKRHSLPFAQIWIPDSQFCSMKALITTKRSVYDGLRANYSNYSKKSNWCYIQRGKAVVGRAFSSLGSCFCKDVTQFSLTEYPLVPTARQASLTLCFAICLQSKCANGFVYVVECFLPPNEMVDGDAETFLNKLLSTMKEQLPDVTVASGQELGQRIVVEVVNVSPSDELSSFEIGQPLPSVRSLQDGGKIRENDYLHQQSNLRLPRIEKYHGITREKLEEQFGKTLVVAAKNLSVSRSTLKRICREYDIPTWPGHKNRKVNDHASKGVALLGVEPYVEDQESPKLFREKGTDRLAHKRSPATGKACDSVMTLKVEYGDDIIKFKLTPESTREDIEAEVEKRLKISLEKYTIKYQDENDEWVTIATDSDLRDGMDELRLLKRATMRCKIVG